MRISHLPVPHGSRYKDDGIFVGTVVGTDDVTLVGTDVGTGAGTTVRAPTVPSLVPTTVPSPVVLFLTVHGHGLQSRVTVPR